MVRVGMVSTGMVTTGTLFGQTNEKKSAFIRQIDGLIERGKNGYGKGGYGKHGYAVRAGTVRTGMVYYGIILIRQINFGGTKKRVPASK